MDPTKFLLEIPKRISVKKTDWFSDYVREYQYGTVTGLDLRQFQSAQEAGSYYARNLRPAQRNQGTIPGTIVGNRSF